MIGAEKEPDELVGCRAMVNSLGLRTHLEHLLQVQALVSVEKQLGQGYMPTAAHCKAGTNVTGTSRLR